MPVKNPPIWAKKAIPPVSDPVKGSDAAPAINCKINQYPSIIGAAISTIKGRKKQTQAFLFLTLGIKYNTLQAFRQLLPMRQA